MLARVLAVLIALVVGSSGHFHGHLLVLDRLNTDAAAVAPHDRATPRPRVAAARMVVLLVDGLRYDVASRLPALQRLAENGVTGRLEAEFPTFTYAAVATIATGVPPRYHGVRVNLPGPTPALDSLAARADAAGVRVRVRSDFEPFTRLLLLPEGAASIDDLDDPFEGLTFVYAGEVDRVGHLYGAASTAYLEASSRAARYAEQLASRLDLTRDAIVVLSDHGHLERGGHGGEEPNARAAFFLAAGGPFARSETIALSMSDVAPTLAVALGVDQPRHALGRPVLDAFAPAVAASDAALDDARTAALVRWDEANEEAAFVRTIVAAILLALACAALVRRFRLRARDTIPSVLFTVGFMGPYLLAGYGMTWSIPRGYGGFLAETLLFAIIGLALAWALSERTRAEEHALASTLVLGTPYYVVSAYVGLDTTWLAGPASTWGVMWISTLMFYGCLGLGLRGALSVWRSFGRGAPEGAARPARTTLAPSSTGQRSGPLSVRGR